MSTVEPLGVGLRRWGVGGAEPLRDSGSGLGRGVVAETGVLHILQYEWVLPRLSLMLASFLSFALHVLDHKRCTESLTLSPARAQSSSLGSTAAAACRCLHLHITSV